MNTVFDVKEATYYLKVAERCDKVKRPRYFSEEYRTGTPAHDKLDQMIRLGYIMDEVLTYLRDHPKAKCKEITTYINSHSGEVYYPYQKIASALRKLVTSGYVKREKLPAEAIKVGYEPYAEAILVEPSVFSLV